MSLSGLRLTHALRKILNGEILELGDDVFPRFDVASDFLAQAGLVDDDERSGGVVELVAELLQVAARDAALHVSNDRADGRAARASDGQRCSNADRWKERCHDSGRESPTGTFQCGVPCSLIEFPLDPYLAFFVLPDNHRIEILPLALRLEERLNGLRIRFRAGEVVVRGNDDIE